MSTFHVTVGVQYRPSDTHHPASPRVDGRGWFTVDAADEQAARKVADDTLRGEWAGIYTEPRDLGLYPFGILGALGDCNGCGQPGVLTSGWCDWCWFEQRNALSSYRNSSGALRDAVLVALEEPSDGN